MESPRIGCVGCNSTPGESAISNLVVEGNMVYIQGLDEIMEKVRRMKLSNRKDIADELLALALAENEIPDGATQSYRASLMDEYDRRYLLYM